MSTFYIDNPHDNQHCVRFADSPPEVYFFNTDPFSGMTSVFYNYIMRVIDIIKMYSFVSDFTQSNILNGTVMGTLGEYAVSIEIFDSSLLGTLHGRLSLTKSGASLEKHYFDGEAELSSLLSRFLGVEEKNVNDILIDLAVQTKEFSQECIDWARQELNLQQTQHNDDDGDDGHDDGDDDDGDDDDGHDDGDDDDD